MTRPLSELRGPVRALFSDVDGTMTTGERIEASTYDALASQLPVFSPPSNPFDLTAQAMSDTGLYRRVLEQIAQDKSQTVRIGLEEPRQRISGSIGVSPMLNASASKKPNAGSPVPPR